MHDVRWKNGKKSILAWSLACLILSIFGCVVVATMAALAATADEPNYLDAGHTILAKGWVTENTRLHGPLPFYANQLLIGVHSAEGATLANLDPELLFLGRLGMLPFALLTGALVFLWARQVFGNTGGLFALCCYVTNPLMIGYGALLVVDMAYSASMLLALFLLFHFLLQPSIGRAVALGLGLGTALATKYLILLVAPVVLFSAAIRMRRIGPALGIALMTGVIALLTLHAWYGFTVGTATTDPSNYESDLISGLVELPVLGWLVTLLPEPFLAGVDFQLSINDSYDRTFLNGKVAAGHWDYFLWSFLLKTPEWTILLGTWILLRRVPGWLLKRGSAQEWALAWTVVPSGLVLMIYLSFFARLQLGVRYMLPVFSLLFILFGASLLEPLLRRISRSVLVGIAALLLALQGWDLWSTWPNLIAYYNTSAGGQAYSYKHFIDSNSDWLQLRDRGLVLLQKSEGEELQIIIRDQGPRFGRIAIYVTQFGKRDPLDLSRSYHWLDPFTAERNLDAAWWVFEVTPESWEGIIAATDDERSRAELALAYLASGRDADCLRHLQQLPAERAASLRRLRQLTVSPAMPEQAPEFALEATGIWIKLGRFDQAESLLRESDIPGGTFARADVLERHKQPGEGLSVFSSIVHTDNAAILLMAEMLRRQHKQEEALAILAKNEERFLVEERKEAQAIRDRMR